MAYNEVEEKVAEFENFSAIIQSDLPVLVPISSRPKETILVQLGDVFDRGPDGLLCMKILDNIEKVIGWSVVKLYGNHEIMSHMGLSGDYIHPLEVRKFADTFGSDSARIKEFQIDGSVWKSIRDSSLLLARFGVASSSAGIPPLSSSSMLFTHGGVELQWIDNMKRRHGISTTGESFIAYLNRVTDEILSSPPIMNSNDVFGSINSLVMRQSPLWIRDFALLDEDYVCQILLPPILRYFRVARIMVGHTPDTEQMRMRSICDSRIILADSAMSKWILQRYRSLDDTEVVDEPTLDYKGRPAVGNPSALIVKQTDGLMEEMIAKYFDYEKNSIHVDTLYPHESVEKQYQQIPTITYSQDLVAVPDPTMPRGSLSRIKYEYEGISQTLFGHRKRQSMLALQKRQKILGVQILGIPLLYMSEKSIQSRMPSR
jgi:hypothetical protein